MEAKLAYVSLMTIRKFHFFSVLTTKVNNLQENKVFFMFLIVQPIKKILPRNKNCFKWCNTNEEVYLYTGKCKKKN